MNINDVTIENFDSFLTESANSHIQNLRQSNNSYKDFLKQLNAIVSELAIPNEKVVELETLLTYRLGIETDYMFIRGLSDGLALHNYLDHGYIEKHISGLESYQ